MADHKKTPLSSVKQLTMCNKKECLNLSWLPIQHSRTFRTGKRPKGETASLHVLLGGTPSSALQKKSEP